MRRRVAAAALGLAGLGAAFVRAHASTAPTGETSPDAERAAEAPEHTAVLAAEIPCPRLRSHGDQDTDRASAIGSPPTLLDPSGAAFFEAVRLENSRGDRIENGRLDCMVCATANPRSVVLALRDPSASDLPATIEVPFSDDVQSIRLPRVHAVRVRVVTATGDPVPQAQVFWSFAETGAGPRVARWFVEFGPGRRISDEDGRCFVAGLTPMDVLRVSARAPATAAVPSRSDEVTVGGGDDQDVTLALLPDVTRVPLVVRVEGAQGCRGVHAELIAGPGGGVTDRDDLNALTSTCWFSRAHDRTSHTLWIAPFAGGSLCVYENGLVPSDRECVVQAQPTRVLLVRPQADEAVSLLRMTARRPGLSVEGVATPEGAYRFEGLPEGPVRVTGVGWAGSVHVRWVTGAVDANAGEEASLLLR